jgi:hypothetical protein
VALAMLMAWASALPVLLFRPRCRSVAWRCFSPAPSMMGVFAMVNSLVQLIVTNQMRGRVMSVYNLSFRSGMPMGNLVAGWLVPIFYGAGGAGRERCASGLLWACIISWSNAASPSSDLIEVDAMLVFLMAGFLAFAPPTPSPGDGARSAGSRRAGKAGGTILRRPAKAPNDADAQYRLALACSYQAEVAIELHDKKAGQQAAERGIRAGEKAVSLNGNSAEYCACWARSTARRSWTSPAA